MFSFCMLFGCVFVLFCCFWKALSWCLLFEHSLVVSSFCCCFWKALSWCLLFERSLVVSSFCFVVSGRLFPVCSLVVSSFCFVVSGRLFPGVFFLNTLWLCFRFVLLCPRFVLLFVEGSFLVSSFCCFWNALSWCLLFVCSLVVSSFCFVVSSFCFAVCGRLFPGVFFLLFLEGSFLVSSFCMLFGCVFVLFCCVLVLFCCLWKALSWCLLFECSLVVFSFCFVVSGRLFPGVLLFGGVLCVLRFGGSNWKWCLFLLVVECDAWCCWLLNDCMVALDNQNIHLLLKCFPSNDLYFFFYVSKRTLSKEQKFCKNALKQGALKGVPCSFDISGLSLRRPACMELV
jgi:hypothetical protein